MSEERAYQQSLHKAVGATAEYFKRAMGSMSEEGRELIQWDLSTAMDTFDQYLFSARGATRSERVLETLGNISWINAVAVVSHFLPEKPNTIPKRDTKLFELFASDDFQERVRDLLIEKSEYMHNVNADNLLIQRSDTDGIIEYSKVLKDSSFALLENLQATVSVEPQMRK